MSERTSDSREAFRVSASDALLGALFHKHPQFWAGMGNLESLVLASALKQVTLTRPVFIAGLARSGSTILLELLASLKEVVTHRYQDFPGVFTPYWWNRVIEQAPKQRLEPVERAHKDRIKVTPESPEAMEEPLWMAFFPMAHDPGVNNLMDAEQDHPTFEQFYRDHIRKLLLARRGARYVSKGNYNIARLEYILRLFPDARFLIPVRGPAGHIASLMKQQALFCEASRNNPRALAHLRQVGHFEFGLDRRPINTGDRERNQEILRLWQRGEEVRGWALYWAQIYRYAADRMEASQALKQATLVVRYEDLCGSPKSTIRQILMHCCFDDDPVVTADFCDRLALPDYYKLSYSDRDLGVIWQETADTATRFGY